VSAVESKVKIVTGNLIELSSQELVDCNKACRGCKFGYVALAFHYISNHEISTANDHPWKGFEMTCNVTKGNQKTLIAGFKSMKNFV
jgi:hypothetical protein